MILFISYQKLGSRDIEVLHFKPTLQEQLVQIGVPSKFHPKMLSDPSCRNRYRTSAVATRVDEKTITVVWDNEDSLNAKNLVVAGTLTLSWQKQLDVFNVTPERVVWVEANEAPILPEFACLL